jgi:hypothetical protein
MKALGVRVARWVLAAIIGFAILWGFAAGNRLCSTSICADPIGSS